MNLGNNVHLTYCTNIHAGESWNEILPVLQSILPEVKQKISPTNPMGVGLRLSNTMTEELQDRPLLVSFKKWLKENNLYVFTVNGFPYGGFHRQRVKDAVYRPDWTTQDRLNYTMRLFNILAELLPDGIDGGVSTCPLSYKLWYTNDENKKEQAFELSTQNLLHLVTHLKHLRQTTGKILHLDIEPEPDGFIENTEEAIKYYTNYLLPIGKTYFQTLVISPTDAEQHILEHIRICYDVCHFSVEYEKPDIALKRLHEAGIKIGKIQISSALRSIFTDDETQNLNTMKSLQKFIEPVYLHQVILSDTNNLRTQFPDLDSALKNVNVFPPGELRTHFHVPIYVENYGSLHSTQSDILATLEELKNFPYTTHLEVETYTWEVLPELERKDIVSSIVRELQWVINHLQ